MSEEDDDDIEDISQSLPSTWAILINKHFARINKVFEQFPQNYKPQLQKLLQHMMDLISDIAYATLDNRKQLDSLCQSEFKTTELTDLFKDMSDKSKDKPSSNDQYI